MKYTLQIVELENGNPEFQVTQNISSKNINICYGYHENINEPMLVEIPVQILIVSDEEIKVGDKVYSPRRKMIIYEAEQEDFVYDEDGDALNMIDYKGKRAFFKVEGYAPRMIIDKLVSGELKIGDEIFPDYKGFGEHLEELKDNGLPTDISELINLANKYNTPIPITKL